MRSSPMAHELEFRKYKRRTPVTSVIAMAALLAALLFVFAGGLLEANNGMLDLEVPHLDFGSTGTPAVKVGG